MTPQEEQTLVQIIVQCVRAVLEATGQETAPAQPKPKQGARFIDVVPRQDTNSSLLNGGQNGHVREAADRNRDDVRESLRRFLQESEPPATGIKQTQMQPPQKRQLITREDVLAALRQGIKVIALQPDAVVTPLARQVAKEKGIELR